MSLRRRALRARLAGAAAAIAAIAMMVMALPAQAATATVASDTFFDAQGASEAADFVRSHQGETGVSVGSDQSATSLPNVGRTIAILRETNEIRSGLGLNELKVSYDQTAMAQSAADYNHTHGMQHIYWSSAQNVAYGYSDPIDGWYYEEKEIFDAAAATDPSIIGMDYWQLSDHNPDLASQVGHYMNIIDPDLEFMGLAVASGNYWAQNLSDSDGDIDVDDYQQTLENYVATSGWTPFTDVNPADTSNHGADVVWLSFAGITQGYGDGTFRGAGTVTRQDMAAFLYRMAQRHNIGDANAWRYGQNDVYRFYDVDPFFTSHAEEILWLAHAGIAGGYSNGSFRGMNPVTRQDMAAFLHRLAKLAGKDGGVAPRAFSDQGTYAHAGDVEWLGGSGIAGGFGDGSFRGMNPVTRQDMAAFLHRLDNRLA